MGLYDLRNIFTKEPVAIAGTVRSILFIAVLLGLAVLDEKQLAGIALGLELLLGLFVRNAVTPTSAPTLPEGTVVSVERTDPADPTYKTEV